MIVPAQLEFAERAKAARARMSAIPLPALVRIPAPQPVAKRRPLSAKEAAEFYEGYLWDLYNACAKADELRRGVPRPPVTLASIVREVAAKHGFLPLEIRAQRRHGPLVRARQEFCWRASRETEHSTVAIGRFIARDHTTVIASIRRHAERVEKGEAL